MVGVTGSIPVAPTSFVLPGRPDRWMAGRYFLRVGTFGLFGLSLITVVAMTGVLSDADVKMDRRR